ncbi:MAG: hypothetical protein ABI293_00565 [Rhodanobacter sp.]
MTAPEASAAANMHPIRAERIINFVFMGNDLMQWEEDPAGVRMSWEAHAACLACRHDQPGVVSPGGIVDGSNRQGAGDSPGRFSRAASWKTRSAGSGRHAAAPSIHLRLGLRNTSNRARNLQIQVAWTAAEALPPFPAHLGLSVDTRHSEHADDGGAA